MNGVLVHKRDVPRHSVRPAVRANTTRRNTIVDGFHALRLKQLVARARLALSEVPKTNMLMCI